MQSLKSYSSFKLEKQYFKVKDRKTKEGRGFMSFHDGVNLICTDSYVNCMCDKSYATLLLSMKLVKVLRISSPVPFFIYMPASVSLTFHHHIGIWLWQGKPFVFCNQYNHNLSHITADDLRSWCLFCCV